jgi:hypothetical protein
MMENLRMRALKQPVQTERLLEAFVSRSSILPKNAYRIRDPDALPVALQRVMFNAAQEGRIWMAWARGHQTWLFTCQESAFLSRDRGVIVLRVNIYNKQGQLMETATWTADPQGKWERSAA